MTEIVKVCKKHGELTKDQIREEKDNGKVSLRCKECRKITHYKTFERHREKRMQYISQWKKDNRDYLNARDRADRALNTEKHKRWEKAERERDGSKITLRTITSRRGITVQSYNEMIERIGNRCEICGNEETRKSSKGETTRLCIDHCHKTEKVRGMLCHGCNTAIGKFKDDITLLQKAITYLEERS